ncbi:MAG: autotransporter adhesin family protein [Candidatus Bathyarchaeota archaeon]|nr:autotransporter adhesin family protein [Candidatus Termiticorpusculum sp.]
MSNNLVNVQPNSNLCDICSKKAFVSLIFMITLVSFSLISETNGQVWCGNMINVYVENEVELREAISAAPDDWYIIGIANDIKLEKSLEIPAGKFIGLVSNRLIGCNGMDTIIVKNGGSLSLWNGIVITHVEGDTGRGVYVEQGGMLDLLVCEISGNTATHGGGVYNEGTVTMRSSNDIMPGSGVISGNTATEGGGVYNTGTFIMEDGEISNNNCPDTTNSIGIGGGAYNKGTFNMNKGSIFDNTATKNGDVYNVGTVKGTGVISIGSNTALNGENDNAPNENRGSDIYLLLIGVAAIVTIVAVLLFYQPKSRKQPTVTTCKMLNLYGMDGYV